jgi:hypothetical protein
LITYIPSLISFKNIRDNIFVILDKINTNFVVLKIKNVWDVCIY